MTDAKEIVEEWQNTPTNKTATDRTREIQVPAHHPALVVLVGSVAGRSYPVGDSAVIGRGPITEVQVPALDVSRKHARIWRDGNRFMIEDLGSCNGTLVDGTPLTAAVGLRYGSRIQLGTSTVLVLTHHSPLEDRLVEQQKLEAVGRVAGGVAAEFSRLLTQVRSGLEEIREAARRPMRASELLDRIDPLGSRVAEALEVTDQLLAFARPAAPVEDDVDLGTTVNSVVRLLDHGADGIDFVLKLEPDMVMRGDPLQLQQVLMALCLHARDSLAGRTDGRITITARRIGDKKGSEGAKSNQVPHFMIAIADNGPGMDEQLREQIFEPFLSSRTARGGRPGLAAAYAIVKNHNGHLEVDSEVGRGTIFRLYLPATKDSSSLPTLTAAPTVREE